MTGYLLGLFTLPAIVVAIWLYDRAEYATRAWRRHRWTTLRIDRQRAGEAGLKERFIQPFTGHTQPLFGEGRTWNTWVIRPRPRGTLAIIVPRKRAVNDEAPPANQEGSI